jgi:hypothetical protein
VRERERGRESGWKSLASSELDRKSSSGSSVKLSKNWATGLKARGRFADLPRIPDLVSFLLSNCEVLESHKDAKD